MKNKKIGMSLIMTSRCNLSCDYCIQKSRNEKKKYELDIDDAITYIDKFEEEHKEYDIISIEFFGGEPTLKKNNIMKCLNILKTKKYFNKLEFKITTNCFIYFPEFILFMKENDIKRFRMSLSYDLTGQEKRSKNPVINKIIYENILKYKQLVIDCNFNLRKVINLCPCITEGNVEELYNYFLKTNYELGMELLNITPVFPEYWKYESFKKLHNQFKKIYNHIIETKNDKLDCFLLRFPFRDISRKHNVIKHGKNILKFDKIEFICTATGKNRYYFHKDLRGSLKNTIKIKPEIKDIFETVEELNYKDFELMTLKKFAVSENIFDFFTFYFLAGANIKRYKNELYELFEYNIFLAKRYIKVLKKLRTNININITNYLYSNGIAYFLREKLGGYLFEKINEKFLTTPFFLDFNNLTIKNPKYKIIYKDIDGFGCNNKKDTIFINKKLHTENYANIQETVLHELFHLYLIEIGVDDMLIKNKHRDIVELLCENFIKIFKEHITKMVD